MTFPQIVGKCYCWSKGGHKSPQNFLKNTIPREEWGINKVNFAQTLKLEKNEDNCNDEFKTITLKKKIKIVKEYDGLVCIFLSNKWEIAQN